MTRAVALHLLAGLATGALMVLTVRQQLTLLIWCAHHLP